ncbi:unnamed protein product [Gemmata massiliana]|uniref:Major facilitator superfamily (MFS) profile domain-containing protein n=1 Tax=Gemmata massiliana TaxID=1210884 RepID=A0A6P2DGJ8_9BACT|nr:hypothetical protein [Gemmata massiliana]VTS01366.1 unnamed protein product [Gemmata massiliana]
MRRVLTFFYLVEGTIGFTLGLYLYTYLACTYDKLDAVPGRPAGAPVGVGWLGLGLTPIEWGIFLLAWLNVCIAVFEFPTGLVADYLGRKVAVVAALVVRGLFFGCLAAVASFGADVTVGWGMAAMTCLALAAALRSGSSTAWFRDHLSYQDRIQGGTQHVDRYPTHRARSRMLVHSLLIVGTCISVACYTLGESKISYYLGAAASLLCAIACGVAMPENRQYAFKRTLAELIRLIRQACRIYIQVRSLWIVTLCGIGVWAVFYVVDAYWLLLFTGQFSKLLGVQLNEKWLLVIVGFTGASFLGNWAFEVLVRRPRFAHLATDGNACAGIMRWVSAVHGGALVCVTTLWFAGIIGDQLWPHFVLLVSILVIHKFADGAAEPTLDTLENVFIEADEQTRATILSIISLIRHLTISVIFTFGIVTGLLHLTGGNVNKGQLDQIVILWAAAGSATILVSAFTRVVLIRICNQRG